jgi:hypothetical protein
MLMLLHNETCLIGESVIFYLVYPENSYNSVQALINKRRIIIVTYIGE